MHPVSSLLAIASLSLAATAAPAAAEMLYTNDFGTAAQYATYRVTVEGNGVVEFRAGGASYPDLDNDGLSQLLLYNNASNGRAYFAKSVYAPLFHTLASPRFSAKGSGYRDTNNAGAAVEIGIGGVYSAANQTEGHIADSSPVSISAQLTGPAYQKLLSFDTRARMEVLGGAVPPGAGRPRIGNFQIEAEVNPAEVGDRVWVYKNDFGTAAALNEWTIDGQAITANTATTARDLDGDNLGRRVEGDTTTSFSTTMTVRVDAPTGYRFADAIAEATAGGDLVNHGSQVTLSLSADGVNFSAASAQTGSGATLLTADATGLAAFSDLSSVWVRIDLEADNHGGIRPFVQNLLVSGELIAVPEPGSLAIAVIGGLLALPGRRGHRA